MVHNTFGLITQITRPKEKTTKKCEKWAWWELLAIIFRLKTLWAKT